MPAARKRCSHPGCRKLAAKERRRCDEHKPGAAAPSSGKLTGHTEPRLFTPPLRPLTRGTTRGFEVIDFAEAIGAPLLPWQEWVVKHALELNRDGSYRFRTVLVLVARQNGKSHLKRIISLWRLYMDGARMLLGVAQDLSLAREQWQMALDLVLRCPALTAELGKRSHRNGDEWFELSGGRYKISAANRSAGRGLSIDELTIDELREQRSWDAWSALYFTTMARPKAQIWAMSNAGDDQSVVLNQLRASALARTDPTLGLFEWSAPDGCDLGDRHGWACANPALGHLMNESAIISAKATSTPGVFRTEVLCQKVDQLDGAIDLAAWRDGEDQAGNLSGQRSRIGACFDISPDGSDAALAVAAVLDDGRVRVELAGHWESAEEALREMPALLDRINPAATGWYPTGPGGAFSPMLRQRPNAVELTGSKAAEACMGFAQLAETRKILHGAQHILDTQVSNAQKIPAADGWRFGRKDKKPVNAAYAAAGAAYIAQTLPPEQRARIRVLG
jgi:hypothetical protein